MPTETISSQNTVIINKLSLDQFTLRGSGCTVYLAVQARPLSASDKQWEIFTNQSLHGCRSLRNKFSMWAWFSTEDVSSYQCQWIVVAYWLIDRISCYLHPFIRCDAKRNDISVGASPWATN